MPLRIACASVIAIASLVCPSIASASSQTLTATADSYVSAAHPASNYGSSTRLYVGSSPIMKTYLLFDVELPGTAQITGATLKLYAGSGSTSAGYQAHAVANVSWGESTITYQNAPTFQAKLGTSGGWSTPGYKAATLAAGSIRNGLNSIALTTSAIGAQSYWSREAGSNPPELVVSYTLVPTKHFAMGSDYNQGLALSLGFNLMDIPGSLNPRATKAVVDKLPPGVRGLIWVGNVGNAMPCTAPDYTTAQFKALVSAMASDPKVYGYTLADEPHPLVCTNAVSEIQARADYIHSHSAFQKAYIVVADGPNNCPKWEGCEYRALRPANSHVDLIGLDPYPCHYPTLVPCDFSMINQRVASALKNGIPLSAIVPVIQNVGEAGRLDGGPVFYRLPSTTDLSTILSTWKSLVPSPAMDVSYTFGVQCTVTACPAPQALGNTPPLQPIMKAHNHGS